MLTFGSFTPAVLVPAWLAGNTTSATARATTLGLISGLQNLGGIISSLSFKAKDAPVSNSAFKSVSLIGLIFR